MIKPHHTKKDVCYKRPAYREARWERAVKVYTINQESKYLLVHGVPAVGASRELVERFALYGDIEEYCLLHEYPTEEFTEVYWVKYKRLTCARFGKKKLDNSSFFGGMLHVCYAPEYETIIDTREKLIERKATVSRKCKEYEKDKAKDSQSTNESSFISVSDNLATLPSENFQGVDDSLKRNVSDANNISVSNISSCTASSLNTFPKLIDNTQPRIPTKNATLPIEIQNLSAIEVYPSYHEDIIQNAKQFPLHEGQYLPSNKTFLSNCHPKEGNNSDKNTGIRNKRRVINWNIPVSNISCTPLSQKANTSSIHSYSQEPGAWDPYKEERKLPKIQKTEGKDELGGTVNTIREILSKSAEPSSKETLCDVCPLQGSSGSQLMLPRVVEKKRKEDGRKRI